MDFELASGVDGIDDEITLLRVKINSILKTDPNNLKLIMQATNMLARLVKIRYNITESRRTDLKKPSATLSRTWRCRWASQLFKRNKFSIPSSVLPS